MEECCRSTEKYEKINGTDLIYADKVPKKLIKENFI